MGLSVVIIDIRTTAARVTNLPIWRQGFPNRFLDAVASVAVTTVDHGTCLQELGLCERHGGVYNDRFGGKCMH